jgi:hypothetical protein
VTGIETAAITLGAVVVKGASIVARSRCLSSIALK